MTAICKKHDAKIRALAAHPATLPALMAEVLPPPPDLAEVLPLPLPLPKYYLPPFHAHWPRTPPRSPP